MVHDEGLFLYLFDGKRDGVCLGSGLKEEEECILRLWHIQCRCKRAGTQGVTGQF
jgi:hypothetical protein